MGDVLISQTISLEPNSSYFIYTKNVPMVSDPMSGSTMGLMMMLSVFQVQAPYMSPTYSGAAAKAGQAAYIESGGQAFQDKLTSVVTKDGTEIAHGMGITDPEMGVVGGAYKIFKTHQIDLKGPRIYSISTKLTVGETSGTVELKYGF